MSQIIAFENPIVHELVAHIFVHELVALNK
jgi:hypothetical protein